LVIRRVEPNSAALIFANCHETLGGLASAEITYIGNFSVFAHEQDPVRLGANPKITPAVLE